MKFCLLMWYHGTYNFALRVIASLHLAVPNFLHV